MRKYKFKGKWTDQIESIYFSQLNSDKFFKHEMWEKHKVILENGRVPIVIKDERTVTPDPTSEQINAINFILNNEVKVYDSVFQNLIRTVYPNAKKYYDLENEDEETVKYWFPALNSISDMENTLGIMEIEVDIEYRNEMALTHYVFEFSGEQEHGLKMTFDGDKFLGFGDRDDDTMRKILTESEYLNYQQKLQIKHPLQIYKSDSKYGVLKPWQEYSNDFYPIALLKEEMNEELFNYLVRNPIIAKEKMDTLLNNSKALKFNEVTNKLNELKSKL